MLRMCCQQSPRNDLNLRSRCSSVIASQRSTPILSLMQSMTASASKRRVQRAPLHVSVQSTVSSASLCSPMLSGDGQPAAKQLPAPPFSLSYPAIHFERRRHACTKMPRSMWASTAAEVPPSGRTERPRKQMSSLEPSAYWTCALQLKTPLPNFVLSSPIQTRGHGWRWRICRRPSSGSRW